MSKEYVLRPRDEEELKRLQFQHKVWKEETELALFYGDIKEGEVVIDLGCGPGFLGFEIAERVGDKGMVYCLDNSETFIEYIRGQDLPNVTPVRVDIRQDLGPTLSEIGSIDRVIARWVLMFTGNAEKVLTDCYESMAPGGRFVSMEYFNFRDVALYPDCEIFNTLYGKVWQLLRNAGGDPDCGIAMADHMRRAGFSSVRQVPVQRTGHPGSDLWKWLDMTNRNHANLVEAGLITSELLEQYLKEWQDRAHDPYSYLKAPPLMITVGEKS